MRDLYTKVADVSTPLEAHQQRVIDKLRASHGVLVAHGLGSGKCVRGATRVYTDRGIVPIQALFGDQAQGDEVDLTLDGDGLRVASLVDGAFVSALVRARYRQRLPDHEHTLKVRTARGHCVEVTQAHPMLVIREGSPTWVSAGGLAVGDILGMSADLPSIEGMLASGADLAHLDDTSPLRYEPIESISRGEQGGFVYDLSIDAAAYDHQNYVGGSGGFVLHNTLTSIAAKDALDTPADIIVPAPLVPNYAKEFIKHTGQVPGDARIRSYEKALKDRDVRLDGLAVMDEAHKARNAGTGIARHIAGEVAKAKDRLLLTGTPVYNQPHDLAILLNTAAGRKVLPDDPSLFKATFVGTKTVQAPFLTRLKGQILGHPVEDTVLPQLVNRERLVDAATGYVDVHRGGGNYFPRRVDEHYDVPLGEKQQELYRYHEGKMPWYLRAKIRAGLPLDKAESKDLNAFQGALRQVSNTARAYTPTMTDAEEIEDSAKLKQMLTHLNEMRAANPDHRGVIYSNYLESGILPLSRALTAQGVPHHVFTGEVTPTQRKTMIEDYNSGKVPLLLLSGAGSEGLDLKGTRSIQLMEPHWNPSRIEQVIGRGIRYKSHEHLPDKDREVKVMTYHSTLPKDTLDRAGEFFLGSKPKQSIEQYLAHMSEQKDMLSKQIANALQEASDRGPLKPRLKFGAAGATFGDVVDAMDGVSIIQQKRKRLLRYSHPSGVTLDSEYNPSFAHEQLHSTFEGDPRRMASQLQDDFLNMGYASLGQLDKTNEKNRLARAAKWSGWGTLAGIPVFTAGLPKAIEHLGPNHPRLLKALMTSMPILPAATMVGTGTLGWHLGKATYKPLGIEDMTASNKHPLLIPPKVTKAKVKLEVKDK